MKMNKVTVSRKIDLDYGHTLPNHMGFCNQLHGHRATVVATVEGEIDTQEGSSSQGMVLDFKFLKQAMMKVIHDKLDHAFAVWKEDEEDRAFIEKRNARFLITDEPPTAEYLAKWSYFQLMDEMPDNVTLVNVRWYETPNSWADYSLETFKENDLLQKSVDSNYVN